LAMTYGGVYNILTKASYSGAVLDANGNPVAKTDTSGSVYGSITLSGANASLKINGNTYTLIHSLDQLAALDDATGTASGYFALAENLDAAAWSNNNTGKASVISILSGTLAGLGHTISNLTLAAGSSNNVGLIGTTVKGEKPSIRDIGLENVTISTTGNSVGALIGSAYAGLSIKQAYSTGTISAGVYAGGLVGQIANSSLTTGSIKDSYSKVDITAASNVGGLVGGANLTTITNSHATGNITASGGNVGGLAGSLSKGVVSNSYYATGSVTSYNQAYVGGLIGYFTTNSKYAQFASITNSFAAGNVNAGYFVGGLIGRIDAGETYPITVDNCYATGNVTGTYASTENAYGGIGGLIGWTNYVNISNSHATGDVISAISDVSSKKYGTYTLNYLGGLVGYMNSGSITNSYATGNVIGQGGTFNWYMGGLVGYNANAGAISHSYATGNVTNGYSQIGGLVGLNSGPITSSWATGNVSGNNAVAGLVGASTGAAAKIIGCMASGNVKGIAYTMNGVTYESKQVGGLVGYLNGSVSDSSATGSVTGGDNVGGLAGDMYDGSINNSSASGEVTGTGDNVGGIVGSAKKSSITNSYWNSDSTGQNNAVGTADDNTTIANSQGLTTEQFKDVKYYLDGTINQVLAERAAAVYQADASSQAGSTMGHARQDQIDQPLFSAKIIEQQQPSVESHIVYADSADYSADIKAINADGVEFDLEDGPRKYKH